jgi:histone deacetylase complex regulatory component SIN3
MANKPIKQTELRKALDTYNEAKRIFENAKRTYENSLDEAETMRKAARAIFDVERDKFYKRGSIFTRFMDENPDPDEDEEEDDEDAT